MSLLCVCVKKARLVGSSGPGVGGENGSWSGSTPSLHSSSSVSTSLAAMASERFNTYVTLKLQNVKSTTIQVKGNNPCWEQDFMFETDRLDMGLIVEVWNKGMLWDKLLGLHWLPLRNVKISNQEGEGKWLSLDSELIMLNGEVKGTRYPSGHSVLIDARFEIPYEAVADLSESEANKIKEKLDVLNSLDAEIMQNKDQLKRQTNSQSGMSEDSDYTSDINYPLPHQHNSSAHQFRGEPSYPLNHDNSREYTNEYGNFDSFEGDEYVHRNSYEQMESFDQGGSFEREMGYEQVSFEQEELYDQDYRDYGHIDQDYDGDDREYDRTEQDYQRSDRDYESSGYERSGRDYERSNRDFERLDRDYERSNRDYERSDRDYSRSDRDYERSDRDYHTSDRDYERSDRDYERSERNYNRMDRQYEDSTDHDYDQNFKSPDRDYEPEENDYYNDYDRSDRDYERTITRYDRNMSRESDYLPSGSPYHLGRSDTDSEPLSYNSRPPNNRHHINNIMMYGPGGSPGGSHGSHGSRLSSVTRQSTQDFSPLNSRSSTNISRQSTQDYSDPDLLCDNQGHSDMRSPARARWIDAFNKVCAQLHGKDGNIVKSMGGN